jgi:hypothetical protein
MAHVHVVNPVAPVPKSEAASKDHVMAQTSGGGDAAKPTVVARGVSVKYDHLVAGMSGGVVSTFILHPLDLVKIRFAGKKSGGQFRLGPALLC